MIRLALAGLLMAQLASVQDLRPSGPWRSTTSKRGDTTVVRTLSGSIWGAATLVEDLRIGSRDGDGPDSFGLLNGFAMFPDGVLVLFDQSVPALRLFSPDGKHLRTLGRSGAGPGEYREQSLGLAVDRSGVLMMYDPRNARLNRWGRDGTVLPSWRVPAGLYTGQALQVDTAGNTYVKVMLARPEPGKEWQIGLARLDLSGELVDTLRRPPIAGPSEANSTFFSPQKFWFLTRAGDVVTASGAIYGIGVSGSRRNPVRIERASPRIPLAPRERANYQEVSEARSRDPMARTGPLASLPDVKPYFKDLRIDLDGRLWVRLSTPGEEYDPPPRQERPGAPPIPPIRWRERVIWDVFAPDGKYLGQLEFPFRTDLAQARGNHVWTIQRGEDDEQYVVRYRITGARSER